MTENILKGFENITTIMRKCIEYEITNDDGLLNDVEMFIPIYYNESAVDEPCIWMVQHPTHAERQADISQTIDLITPFEFVCVVYEDDLEESETAGQNLANRVILSILRNYLLIQKEVIGKRNILRVELETYYPVGEVEIHGKSERVPATSVILNVVHRVNWKICCDKIISQE